jgi:hypothetical protein
MVGVHEDVRAGLQFGIDAACRFELEGAGPGTGDSRAADAVAREELESSASLVGNPGIAFLARQRRRL